MRRLLASSLTVCAIAAAAVVHTTSIAPKSQQAAPAWRTFEGTWSVTGQQTLLPTERPLPASVTQLSGAVALGATDGLTRAFRGQVITYDDGSGTVTGRAVWTDHLNDRIYSTLRGDLADPKRRVTGAITGGTGAYAGITGDYSFEWQYVLNGEDSMVQGRAVNLRGRFQNGRR